MTDIVAIFGRVSQVRDYQSLGITRIIIDIPVEKHVEATAMVYGQDVLVTLAPASMKGSPYGLRSGGEKPEEPPPGPVKGGPLSELAGQWCRMPGFQKWARGKWPDVVKAMPDRTPGEEVARECILHACKIKSRRDLDHVDVAAKLFHEYVINPFKVDVLEGNHHA